MELKGERIVLRPPGPGDVDDLEAMFADATVAEWWPRFDRARIEGELLAPDEEVDNVRAIACYRKLGFQPVGVMRRYERGADGTFHDSLLMDLLAEELR